MASIILVGPMGAGKTTVGRQLARRLRRTFYDSDREIEASCGVDIPTISTSKEKPDFANARSA